jgi:hypothetical protein
MEGNSNQSQKDLIKKSVIVPASSDVLSPTKNIDKVVSTKKSENGVLRSNIPLSVKNKGAVSAPFSVQKTEDLPSSYQKQPLSKSVEKVEGYEVRTMQHDVDETKGKKIQSVSISKDAPETKKTKSKNSSLEGVSKFGGQIPIGQAPGPKEGTIGKPGEIKKEKKEKLSLIDRFKYYLAQRKLKKEDKPKRTMLVVVLAVIILIGGAGYYLYTSGALSSLDGIIQELFGIKPVEPIATTTPPIATTTPTGTTTITVPPIDQPTTTTSTDPVNPPVDPPISIEFVPSDSFFEPDSSSIIHLKNVSEVFDELKEDFENNTVESNQFKRVIITAEESFSGISLAQIWKGIKSLATKGDDEVEYTELLSSEIIDSWGLAMPNNIYGAISENYNLFFYGQPDDGARVVLVFKLDNSDIKNSTIFWEDTMVYDLKNIFLGRQHGESSSETYQDNFYKDVHIRYLNLPKSNLTMDHVIVGDYLVLTTSREAAWATVDKLLEESVDVSSKVSKIEEVIIKYDELVSNHFKDNEVLIKTIEDVEFIWYEKTSGSDVVSTRINGHGLEAIHSYDPVIGGDIKVFFKDNNFELDSNNSGDATLTSSLGYKIEGLVCLETFGVSDPDDFSGDETYFRKLYCGEIIPEN